MELEKPSTSSKKKSNKKKNDNELATEIRTIIFECKNKYEKYEKWKANVPNIKIEKLETIPTNNSKTEQFDKPNIATILNGLLSQIESQNSDNIEIDVPFVKYGNEQQIASKKLDIVPFQVFQKVFPLQNTHNLK